MLHSVSSVTSIQCVGGQCSSSEMPCVAQCLQQLDRSQQRAIAEVVTLVAVIAFASVFFVDEKLDTFDHIFSPPPWQSHRLFAFRE